MRVRGGGGGGMLCEGVAHSDCETASSSVLRGVAHDPSRFREEGFWTRPQLVTTQATPTKPYDTQRADDLDQPAW